MRRGFTLIELIVAMGLIVMLVGLTSFNLLSSQRQVVKTGIVEQVVADIRSQQSKAMQGDDQGSAFGIHFDSSSYVLFSGGSYNANDNSNYVVTLDNNIQFTSTFSGNTIIFTPLNGQVNNYVSGSDTVTIIDATDNSFHTLHVNTYGVVDQKT